MPFSSIDELRQSELFKRLKSLQTMTSARLARFAEVFNRIHERATRNGADDTEAEARAIPIALTAARNAAFMPAGRNAEATEHVFAAMAKDMSHSAGEDVDLTFPDSADLDLAFAGQPFFAGAHRSAPDGVLADPVGVIRRIASRSELPAELQAKIDPDIEVVMIGSFFDDVPAEERHSSISPEWETLSFPDGRHLAIPHNFIITPTPMNDEVMGIGMVAGLPKPYEGSHKEGAIGVSPMAEGQDNQDVVLTEKVASLEAQLAETRAALDEKDASIKEFGTFKTKFASLFEEDAADEVTPDEAVAKVAALKQENENLTSRVAAIEKAAAEKTATGWATDLSSAGKIPTDAIGKWAGLYLSNKEMAEDLASGLKAAFIVEADPKAASLHGDGTISKEELNAIKEVF